MATPWPQQPAWPTPFREHATRLSTYLQDALTCIDRTQSQPVPTDLVKIIIHGTQPGCSCCQLEANCFHLFVMDHHATQCWSDLWIVDGYGVEHASFLDLSFREWW
jgi:hypothetical protein